LKNKTIKLKDMNVKQALKAKNKLVGDIKECYKIIQSQNSIEEGNPRRYSVKGQLEKIAQLTDELVQLKAQLHRANVSVYEKIFQMAEIKGIIKELKKMDVSEGKQDSRYGSVVSVKEVEVNVVERDAIVKEYEAEVERIQNELDIHNSNTNI
jgi:copper chaperone CopZ